MLVYSRLNPLTNECRGVSVSISDQEFETIDSTSVETAEMADGCPCLTTT